MKKTPLEISTEVKQLCGKITRLTDNNDHTGSVVTLATFLKVKSFIALAKAIETIHTHEVSIPQEIKTYRENLLKRMIKYVAEEYNEDTAKHIYSKF